MPEDLAAIVAKLCFTDRHPAILNAAGPDELSLKELILLSNRHISLVPISRAVADPGMRLMATLLPNLINSQQYELLLRDNVADTRPIENLLGRSVHSTKSFWQKSI